MKNDFFTSIKKDDRKPTYPYTVKHTGNNKETTAQIISSTTKVIDSQKPDLDGYREINTDSDTGETILQLQRGDSILYHSESNKIEQSIAIVEHEREFITELPSSNDWVALEFSNNKLPDKFAAKIKN